jgi:hypothetical protein
VFRNSNRPDASPCKGDLGPFVGKLTYEFEDVDGRTRLTNTASLEARGLMRIASPIASGRIREAVAANLGALKQLLEHRDTTPERPEISR